MNETHLILIHTNDRLELHDENDKNFKPIFVDFVSGKNAYRRLHGGGRRQLLARAIGLKPGYNPFVIDATAGFGEDAFVMAYLGCEVVMLERSPMMGALLEDGLRRANLDPEFSQLKWSLDRTDALIYLTNLLKNKKLEGVVQSQPDVIYLDPMFPHRERSALVKKDMRVLRELVGDDHDAHELLKLALEIAKKRVVVKRPRIAPAIEGIKPSLVMQGQRNRYDVYFIHL